MPTPQETAGLIADLRRDFPWLSDIGLSTSWLQDVVATAASASEIVQQIRSTPQYKQRFPAIVRGDGSRLMTEAEYISQENSYRQLLRQFGFNEGRFRTPATLVGFFQGEVAPAELQDRLTVWKQVREGGQRIKEAFYVYAGLEIDDDTLYEAIVDPAAEQNLTNAYNQAVASSTFDYTTWITRATQVGLSRVAAELGKLKERGAVTAEAVQRIQATAPEFARQIMDAIYTGGMTIPRGGQAGSLDLQELLDSFEFAAIGAAAKNAGLELPTKERLAEIRAAGVDRAKAIQGYREFGKNSTAYAAAVQRARGTAFGQEQFEAGQFLGDAQASRDFEAGLAYMESAGKSQGSFRFGEEGNRFVQKGLTAA
jgi:hypothetical protein